MKFNGINVMQFTKEGQFIKIHENAEWAVKNLGFNANGSSITQCCKGKQKFAYGFKWTYSNISFYDFEPDLPGEEWKMLPEYSIRVSNKERIQRVNGLKTYCQLDKIHGYYCIAINGRNEKRHRLIAMAWVPNPNNYNEVDHIEGLQEGDFPENLRWVTHLENMNNRYDQSDIYFETM